MKYSDDYMYAKDIDWFCVINDNYIHAASAVGIQPEPINDREKLRKLQKQVYDLSPIFLDEDIIINHSFINERFYDNNEEKNEYRYYLEQLPMEGDYDNEVHRYIDNLENEIRHQNKEDFDYCVDQLVDYYYQNQEIYFDNNAE